jgi:hypothetical protein
LLGLAYAFGFYYHDKRNEFSRSLKIILGIFRAVIISIIAFLLLNPLIRSVSRFVEKPVIIFAQDNSESIIRGADSVYFLNQYNIEIQKLLENLETDYQVKRYTFGNDVKETGEFDFSDVYTDFSQLFDELYNRYSYRNVGALIIASDGIYNRGFNPAYSTMESNFPIYTIAIGDTAIRKDIIVSKVNYNRLAYLNNEFPVEIEVNGRLCKGLTTEVLISKDNNTIYRKEITFKTNNDFVIIKTHIKAEETGLQRYTVNVSPKKDEVSTVNNTKDVFIDILEGKTKVLLLANAPHPDVSALKQSIQNNINYELETYVVSDFEKNLKEFNLVILHGLPSLKNNITNLLDEIQKENIPVLYLVNQQTYVRLFNEQNAGVNLSTQNVIYNESQPLLNKDFTLFSLLDESSLRFENFPPLISPYGNIQLQPTAVILLNQKIGSVNTMEPLIVFNQMPDSKSGVILGEGIWRWRMSDYASYENFNAFDDLINRTVQFLSLKIDKSLFRIFHKTNFEEGENIEFEAELYDDIYELINDPEINITITGSDGTNYPFYFSRTVYSYFLDAGSLPPDSYSYKAKVQSGDKLLIESGEFTVSSVGIENINTIANHNMLFKLSKEKGGEMYFPGQLDQLSEKIKNREDIVSISYVTKKFTEIISLPWILSIILLLLSVEWFLRKRAGGY